MADSASSPEVRQALERGRDGHTDKATNDILEAAITSLWKKINAQKDYVLDRDEFALFNYFIYRYKGNVVAQRTVARFWDHYRGDPNATGSKT
ncbi:uncharacterized protein BP01DRAFT_290547 [Aspergillus saccharolyticus JOP 1030-1]|uniref:Uncharacterized protein n=1 Tax=Aspergillus saccharolyticus JOP 1030-1 TaxID=1450539 RepID=A0A318ZLT1_9EURO|nr:hypothetical protein BP01DRAFT_290547 [Aspergillus saccharolyticus JOP 1030-1]PYH47695.1 hypothetical protein BP01DRAFT_290547 [Aspergillus saccharolyticus JOP 1030-1]